MLVERRLRGLGFQQRIAVYSNRITAANWLMILIAVLTVMQVRQQPVCEGAKRIGGFAYYLSKLLFILM